MSTLESKTCPYCAHVVRTYPGRAAWALAVHTWPCSVATAEERAAWQTARRWPRRVSEAARVARAAHFAAMDRETDGEGEQTT